MQKAAFGGGCFWCTEAIFKMLKGVHKVLPGYAGGRAENANYEKVSTGVSGHAEVVYIEYNPKEIAFSDLLKVFFATHDPTTLNKQGSDVGPQYRSVIFYTTPKQKKEAERFIAEINTSNYLGDPVETAVEEFDQFFEAEDYHRDYFEKNRNQPYCQVVINPKLEKVQKEFTELLKAKS